MNSNDVFDYSLATQDIKNSIVELSKIYKRTKINKFVWIDELVDIVEKELGVKLLVVRESKKGV